MFSKILDSAIRYLLRKTVRPRGNLRVMCSGIIPQMKGNSYCIKKIRVKDAVDVYWVEGNQGHHCYFCSWKCLVNFAGKQIKGR